MRSILLATFMVAALAISPMAAACSGSSTPVATTCPLTDPCHYFVFDVCQPNCLFNTHVYRESNGQPGLQRADAERDDTCGGQRASDTRTV